MFGSCCLSTVPITEAMQITVSSAMAKRIDDNSSMPVRSARDPVRMRTPWVVSDMEGEYAAQKEKGRGHLEDGPASFRVRNWRLVPCVGGYPPCAARNSQRRPAM